MPVYFPFDLYSIRREPVQLPRRYITQAAPEHCSYSIRTHTLQYPGSVCADASSPRTAPVQDPCSTRNYVTRAVPSRCQCTGTSASEQYPRICRYNARRHSAMDPGRPGVTTPADNVRRALEAMVVAERETTPDRVWPLGCHSGRRGRAPTCHSVAPAPVGLRPPAAPASPAALPQQLLCRAVQHTYSGAYSTRPVPQQKPEGERPSFDRNRPHGEHRCH